MKTLLSCTATLALLGSLGSAVAQDASALGESSLRPMDITCADLMGASEGERSGLVFFLAGYRAAMDQQGVIGGDAAAGAMAVTTEETDPAAVGEADAAAEPAVADAAAEPAADAAPETETVDAAGDEIGGVGDVKLSRSFLGTGVNDILAGCTGNDDMAAINVIGTAAGWPEPSLDTQPGTPEGNQ